MLSAEKKTYVGIPKGNNDGVGTPTLMPVSLLFATGKGSRRQEEEETPPSPPLLTGLALYNLEMQIQIRPAPHSIALPNKSSSRLSSQRAYSTPEIYFNDSQ
jgi:hypothetical protein